MEHPLTRGLDVDDPRVTILRSSIINSKPFLKKIYNEWYSLLIGSFPPNSLVLELGAGAGFIKKFNARAITSDVFPVPSIDIVLDACSLAIASDALDGIVLLDVLHHIPDCQAFFQEAARAVRPGGAIAMIEPWNTAWSRWVYTILHPEPFDQEQRDWRLKTSGPLSAANSALPWIIFQRDRALFTKKNPSLTVESIVPIMPFSYVFSGGVSHRFGLPGWMFNPVRHFEKSCCEIACAMFAIIILRKLA